MSKKTLITESAIFTSNTNNSFDEFQYLFDI